MLLTVERLTKSYSPDRHMERVLAVDDITFGVAEGELFTLLGPSGCGKTTTLRCIAGLERPDLGEIRVAARVLFSSTTRTWVPAEERGLGMVFQSYAIWPHMDVFQNVAFPLEVSRPRLSRAVIRERVERVLEVVRLGDVAGRRATDLSGGQQQRLALARALVMEPPLLLLDEPLSNLDARLREEMRFELKRLQRELGVTTVYVTHDQSEALAMSNTIAVIADGRVVQVGKPREIYERPVSRFVADFIGVSNILAGRVVDKGPSGIAIETPAGQLMVASPAPHDAEARITVAIRPEHIAMRPGEGEPGMNRWTGRIEARAFLGESVDHIVRVKGTSLRVRTAPSASVPEGDPVVLTVAGERCVLLPAGD